MKETQVVKFCGLKEDFDNFVIDFTTEFNIRLKEGDFNEYSLIILRVINGVQVFKFVITKRLANETLEECYDRIALGNHPKPDYFVSGKPLIIDSKILLNTISKKLMNKKLNPEIVAIDKAIENLKEAKIAIQNANGFHKEVEKKGYGTWVINNNVYYQFVRLSTSGNDVYLSRKGKDGIITIERFNEDWRFANAAEVSQHENYLKSTRGKYLTDKKLIGYKLKESLKENAQAVSLIVCDGFPMPSYFVASDLAGSAWSKIKKAGIVGWFDEVYEEVSVVGADARLIDPLKCDFYMITCRGLRGAKVRHETFDVAHTEAKRMAKQENHQCWVVGVVATVKP